MRILCYHPSVITSFFINEDVTGRWPWSPLEGHWRINGSLWVARMEADPYLCFPAYQGGCPLSTMFNSLWKRRCWLCLLWHQIYFGTSLKKMPSETLAVVSAPAKRCCGSSLALYACCSWLGAGPSTFYLGCSFKTIVPNAYIGRKGKLSRI